MTYEKTLATRAAHDAATPVRPRDLSSEWLQAVLDQAGHRADVRGFRWHRIGATKGIGGVVVRVILDLRGPVDAPRSLVIKFRLDEGPLVAEPAELRYYLELADTMPLGAPRCYHAAADLERGCSVLVLEDLGELRPCSDVRGVSRREAMTIVEDLARFHSRFWGTADRELPWVRDYHRALSRELGDWFRENLAASLERLDGRLDRRRLRICRNIVGSELRILELLAEPPRTLAHLDFRADNMFFDRRGRLVVVDFQSISRQRGAADLGRFIGTSVPHSVRRKHLPDLIDAYTDVVGSAEATGYGRDELERDVRLGVLHWLTYALALLPEPVLANGRLLRVVETWIDRLTAAVIEMDAMDALA